MTSHHSAGERDRDRRFLGLLLVLYAVMALPVPRRTVRLLPAETAARFVVVLCLARGDMKAKQEAGHLLPRVLWPLAGAVLTLPFCFNVMRNSDLWWHLAAGRLIVSSHAVPAQDSWSFTAAGHLWLNHEWLAGCIFYGWVRWLGTEGLILWLLAVLLLTSGLLQNALSRWTARPFVGLLCAVWAIAVASPFFEVRPHLYSLLGLALLLRWIVLLDGPDRWWIALVFLPWANLHAGVVLGLLVMGIWTLAWVAGAPLPTGRPGRALPGAWSPRRCGFLVGRAESRVSRRGPQAGSRCRRKMA